MNAVMSRVPNIYGDKYSWGSCESVWHLSLNLQVTCFDEGVMRRTPIGRPEIGNRTLPPTRLRRPD